MDRVQVEILGISTSPASNGAYALILRESVAGLGGAGLGSAESGSEGAGARRIPIIIGGFEAQAIALEMEGIKPPRPLTHDLIKNLIETLGGTVTEVAIVDLKDGTFFAQITINGDQEIDARPSDAIAVAIRFGVNIYVAEHVMTEAGFLPEEGEDDAEEIEEEEEDKLFEEKLKSKPEQTTPKPQKPMSRLEQLTKQLDDAIQKEDYEKAAAIRDDIQKLKAQES